MSLFIEVYVGKPTNRVLVAKSVAHNVSDLADVSTYVFNSLEVGAPHLKISRKELNGKIYDHYRGQSVWRLVEKLSKLSSGDQVTPTPEGEPMVTITRKEYDELLFDQRWLLALESAGVDNWGGIDFAREIFNEEDS